jgi:hypothetical protein
MGLLLLLAACTDNEEPPEIIPPAAGEGVTFFPTYGYREETGWRMHLRGWVHENRTWPAPLITSLGMQTCMEDELPTFQLRTDDFLDDDKSLETVVVAFDGDPEGKQYTFALSKADGITELDLTLPDATARQLLAAQNSEEWLTYRAVPSDHTGLGRVRLIEPQGVSLISDIDDTIKVTHIPAGKPTVWKNTFCRDFSHVSDMHARYEDLGEMPVHYVSGGPEQIYGALYDYLITGAGSFPEGTFHLAFYPKNLLSPETLNNAERLIARALELTAETSLNTTFAHKVRVITQILDHFPQRRFVLAGDSGEGDPEVYRAIRQARPQQVDRIWIRDLANDNRDNAYRLEGMEIIAVEPEICMDDQHRDKLSTFLKDHYPSGDYTKSKTACSIAP